MPWKEIDQNTWTWTIPAERTKTKTRYVMQLPPQVVAILELQQPDPAKRTGWVFSHTGEHSIRTAGQAKDSYDAHIQRRIELATAEGQAPLSFEHWNFHDFRTTAATHMGDDVLNVREEIIELCLAHAPPKAKRSKYQRSSKRAAIFSAFCSWNDYLDEILKQSDSWPGGRSLPPIGRFEFKDLRLKLRKGWPVKNRPPRKK